MKLGDDDDVNRFILSSSCYYRNIQIVRDLEEENPWLTSYDPDKLNDAESIQIAEKYKMTKETIKETQRVLQIIRNLYGNSARDIVWEACVSRVSIRIIAGHYGKTPKPFTRKIHQWIHDAVEVSNRTEFR